MEEDEKEGIYSLLEIERFYLESLCCRVYVAVGLLLLSQMDSRKGTRSSHYRAGFIVL